MELHEPITDDRAASVLTEMLDGRSLEIVTRIEVGGETGKNVAEDLGISAPRVSQLRKDALLKLRDPRLKEIIED